MILSISFFFFTDMTNSIESKTRVGWTCVAATFIGLTVNSIFVVKEVIVSIRRWLRNKKKRRMRAQGLEVSEDEDEYDIQPEPEQKEF